MTVAWSIRPATPDDAMGLQCCMHLAYAPYPERIGGARLLPMDLDYEKEIRDFPTWVATHDGKIVGGITLMFEGGHASIANVAVHPEFQGHGIGKGLMRIAEIEAKEKTFTEIYLATHVSLEENLVLYLHLGWSEISRDDIRVYMRKTID